MMSGKGLSLLILSKSIVIPGSILAAWRAALRVAVGVRQADARRNTMCHILPCEATH